MLSIPVTARTAIDRPSAGATAPHRSTTARPMSTSAATANSSAIAAYARVKRGRTRFIGIDNAQRGRNAGTCVCVIYRLLASAI